MGITFRSGDYVRFVHAGGRTIKDGEAAVIWNRNGIAKEVIGPERVSLFFSTIRFLTRYKAEPHQYLIVKHRSGEIEHKPGPISMYMNPSRHDDGMKVEDGIKLETKNDCIIVFSSKEAKHQLSVDDGNSTASIETPIKKSAPSAERRIISGPNIYFPSVGETIHKFKWSHHNSTDKSWCFHVLTMHKKYMWNRHLTIQTKKSPLNIRVAISYEIGDSIEGCLSIEDPIPILEAALLNDATMNCINMNESNLMESMLKIEEFFPTLSKTMKSVGLRLLKFQVLDIEQSKECKEKVKGEKQEAQRKDDTSHEIHQQIQMTEQLNNTKLKFLKGLQEIGVDVTQVLCANKGNIEKVADNIAMMTEKEGGRN